LGQEPLAQQGGVSFAQQSGTGQALLSAHAAPTADNVTNAASTNHVHLRIAPSPGSTRLRPLPAVVTRIGANHGNRDTVARTAASQAGCARA
jgi:hypothetical protein